MCGLCADKSSMAEPNSPIDPRLYAALRTLSDSHIVRKPRQTIALGILTALVYYTLGVIALALIAGLAGFLR